jgi:nitric oxide reductase NorQ protein
VFLDELNRCPEHARNALMPALDSTRKVFHPIENRFVEIPDNVQFIAAVNRGRQFSGTFGIDAAQLDRFAPLQMDYLPAHEEVALLVRRHGRERGAGEAGGAVDETSEVDAAGQAQSDVFVEGLPRQVIEDVVAVASAVRASPDLPSTLSVRATEEACVFLEHELYRGRARDNLPEVLQTSFCGRFSGRHDDVGSDAGAVWAIVRRVLKERGVKLPDEG